MRRREPCLLHGEYRPRRAHNDIFWFARTLNKAEILVGLNLCREPRLWEWSGSGIRLISSYLDGEQDKVEGPTHLRPNEGVVIKLNR